MKQKLLGMIFLTGVAITDQIDAEIVKNLDFYSDMDMVEDMDQYQQASNTEPVKPKTQISPVPTEKSRE